MKNVMNAGCLLLTVLVLGGVVVSEAAAREPWEKIDIPELNEFQIPAYERIELPSGMVLYLAEDRDLPLVRLSATVRAGAIYEPADKLGLAAMTGTVLRTGGAGDRSGDDIDALVEARGLRVETWVGQNNGGAFLSCLSEDVDLGLELLADILMRPQFAEDKLELARSEEKAGISRRNDEPMQIAFRELPKMLYGADHPLARHPEYATVEAVTRDDLVAFHADWFGPDRTYLVVIGDFAIADMKTRIERAFAGWAPAGRPLPADPEIPWRSRTVNVAAKDGLSQAIVLLGHRGIRNDHPDYAALRVGARILGGGFASRLFKEIRSNRGLAYAVGARAGTGWRYPGNFMAFTMTKNETVEAAALAIMAEIERMLTDPVSDDELQLAKDGILNSEVFDYDSKREVLDRLVQFEMYGYEPSFLQEYQAAVQALTPEDVLAAVRANWKPEDLSFLVVGSPAQFDGDLSRFGAVNEIDITIPAPTPKLEIPAATPESLARGKQLMRSLRERTGGDVYDSITAYHEVSTMTVQSPMGALDITIDTTVELPDRLRMATKLPFGEQVAVVVGETGWSQGMGRTQDLGPDQTAELKKQVLHDTRTMLREIDAWEFQALEPMPVGDHMCDPVAIDVDGEKMVLFLDQQTGLVTMIQQPAINPMTQSPVTQKTFVNEYGEMGGVKMPVSVTVTHDDEDFAEVTVTTFEVNPTVDPSLFRK